MTDIHIHHHYHHTARDTPAISKKDLEDSKKIESPLIKKIKRQRLLAFAKQRKEQAKKKRQQQSK